jgi:mRNA-degrading endonuclease RelE of RelBE toxin-antitoxin system
LSVYNIKFTVYAKAGIRALPKNVRNHLRKELQEVVSVNPVICSEGLTGPLSGFRSYHCGNYRVVFKLYEDSQTVAVVGVGKKNADHSAEIYKQLEVLAGAGKLADTFLKNLKLLAPPQ